MIGNMLDLLRCYLPEEDRQVQEAMVHTVSMLLSKLPKSQVRARVLDLLPYRMWLEGKDFFFISFFLSFSAYGRERERTCISRLHSTLIDTVDRANGPGYGESRGYGSMVSSGCIA